MQLRKKLIKIQVYTISWRFPDIVSNINKHYPKSIQLGYPSSLEKKKKKKEESLQKSFSLVQWSWYTEKFWNSFRRVPGLPKSIKL